MNFLPQENPFPLGEITWRLGLCEALLNLVVDELDKSVVLF